MHQCHCETGMCNVPHKCKSQYGDLIQKTFILYVHGPKKSKMVRCT